MKPDDRGEPEGEGLVQSAVQCSAKLGNGASDALGVSARWWTNDEGSRPARMKVATGRNN
jgi:hypothetical protein